MTRQHFVVIARVVSMIDNMVDRQNAAHRFCSELRVFNPAFDKARFLKACGC